MNTKLYLGLDVHKNSIVVATALADGTEPQSYGKWGGTNLSVERGHLKVRKKFGVEKSEISIVPGSFSPVACFNSATIALSWGRPKSPQKPETELRPNNAMPGSWPAFTGLGS